MLTEIASAHHLKLEAIQLSTVLTDRPPIESRSPHLTASTTVGVLQGFFLDSRLGFHVLFSIVNESS